MEQMQENQLPRRAFEQLAEIPPLPSHLYGTIIGKINRRKIVARSVFGIAASVLVAVSAFTVTRFASPGASYSAEVADELSGVNSYINSDVYQANSNSYGYYDEVLYQE
jgi:hypothetical protein